MLHPAAKFNRNQFSTFSGDKQPSTRVHKVNIQKQALSMLNVFSPAKQPQEQDHYICYSVII